MKHALPYPPAFQDLATLALHTCLSERTIERLVDEGKFPQPRRNKCGKRLWVWKEVEAFLAEPDDNPLDEGEELYANTKALAAQR